MCLFFLVVFCVMVGVGGGNGSFCGGSWLLGVVAFTAVSLV